MKTKRKYGFELQVGDTLKVWWRPGRDTISKMSLYDGPYKGQKDFIGARIAQFTVRTLMMTILAQDVFDVF